MRMRRYWFVLVAASLAPSCGKGVAPPAGEALRNGFPAQADKVLASDGALHEGARAFELAAAHNTGWHNLGLHVQVPRDAAQPVRLRTGGFEIQLREEGLVGEAERDGQAVAYRRDNGSSFWLVDGAVAEEWLLLPKGVASAREPVARWQVSGGVLRQHGDKVAVRDETAGQVHMVVAAPAAYGPKGEALQVSLKVDGDYIALHVQPSAGPVLVDPSWVDYATLVAGRGNHASALLANGDVLATGGDAQGLPSNTAEYYVPSTALWTGVVSMNTSRSFHTATRLFNGSVLVTGGWNGNFPYTSTEWLDAGLTTWTSGPSMIDPRAMHTATTLTNNTVLVCGGFFDGGEGGGGVSSVVVAAAGGGPNQQPVDSCEVFDPQPNNFTMVAYMFDARYAHQAVRLSNGQPMVCGGWGFGVINSCERYVPANNSFFQTGYMTQARAAFTMTKLADGRVLACGGEDNNGVLSTCEIYTPSLGTWSGVAPMSKARTYHTASLLPDGTVLVVGGMDDQFNYLADVEIYDPVANSWMAGPPITDARANQTATTLNNGFILVSGGHDGSVSGVVNSSMVYAADGGNGTSCMVPSDCGSNNCVEGVCCDAPCAGVCESCKAAISGGPEGVCTPVPAGTDPDNECTMEAATSCGMTGACSGQSSCELYPADTECAPSGCMDHIIKYGDYCDGQGTCVDDGATDCGLFSCVDLGDGEIVCNEVCVTAADCASSAYCDVPTGNCTPKKNNGAPALAAEQCVSGIVADGVCCDSACNLGVCDACTVAMGAAVDGICQPISGGCDDGNSCTADMCDGELGCVSESLLDGTPCDGGVCYAAKCILDASTSSGSGGGSGTGSGAGAGSGSGTGSGSGAGDPSGGLGTDGVPALEGGGFCTAAAAHHTHLPTGWLALLGLAGVGALGRRRRRGE